MSAPASVASISASTRSSWSSATCTVHAGIPCSPGPGRPVRHLAARMNSGLPPAVNARARVLAVRDGTTPDGIGSGSPGRAHQPAQVREAARAVRPGRGPGAPAGAQTEADQPAEHEDRGGADRRLLPGQEVVQRRPDGGDRGELAEFAEAGATAVRNTSLAGWNSRPSARKR